MELRPHFEWRGLGFIPHSALQVREEYAAFDAERIFDVPGVRVADPKACQCGEVLKGVLEPWECKVFGTACTPETPIGTCMVSSEGACAAYYNFGRFSRERVEAAAAVMTTHDLGADIPTRANWAEEAVADASREQLPGLTAPVPRAAGAGADREGPRPQRRSCARSGSRCRTAPAARRRRR